VPAPRARASPLPPTDAMRLHGGCLAVAQASARSVLSEKAKPMPVGLIVSNGFFIKRLQRNSTTTKRRFPCDAR
jgi:hypothetical protein